MTPVMLLSDGYLSNAAEPWLIPDMKDIEPIESNALPTADDSRDVQSMAFDRDPGTQGRPWITPGSPKLMHRLGGLEKDIDSGHISYDPENHQRMTDMRAEKVDSVANFIPPQEIELGPDEGDLLVIGWGSTYGPIYQAVQQIQRTHDKVSYTHLRYIHPLPANFSELVSGFKQVLVPEMNMGQLATLLRDKLAIDPVSFCKVTGQPFLITELTDKIRSLLPPVVKAVNDPIAKGKAS
jgi:2-oxoglutarate ferredoxin oxidoreductase subunit alpha